MSEANVERLLKKYAAHVRETYPDIPERVHPHMLRRTRATGLYRDGVDLSIISHFWDTRSWKQRGSMLRLLLK